MPLCAVCGSASGFRWRGSRPLASGEWRVAVECCGNGDTSGDGVSENGVRRVSAPATTEHSAQNKREDRRAVVRLQLCCPIISTLYLFYFFPIYHLAFYRLAFTVYVRGFSGVLQQ